MKKRVVLIALFALLTLALDQGSKIWARGSLRGQQGVTVLDNYLVFEYHENPGMAFGIGRNLPGGRFILIGIGLGVLFIVWRIVRNVQRRQKLADIAYGLVAGGAIGNIIDRLWLGRVVDFVVMHWKHKHSWPAYNVADAALVVGVGLMLIAIAGQPRAQPEGPASKSPGRASPGRASPGRASPGRASPGKASGKKLKRSKAR